MSRFANGNILLTLSCFIRQCKMNIQNCRFCKRCHVRCHWIQDFHLMLYLNSHFLLTQRVHSFLDLGLSYFYRIKVMSWITGEYLQWTIYVKTKSHVYMYIKKTSKKLSRPSNPSLSKWRSLSFVFVFYPLSCTS